MIKESRAWGVARLIRAENCVFIFVLCCVGGIAAGSSVLPANRLVLAGASMALVLAFGNAVNDLSDIDVDRIAKPLRPLPSGTINQKMAVLIAAVLAVSAISLGAILGLEFLAIVASMLFASWLYSYRLKCTVLVGNIVVAGLSGLTVVVGAISVPGYGGRAGLIATGVLLMVLATEVAKAIEDGPSDALCGVRTIAHVLSGKGKRALMLSLGLLYAVWAIVGFAVRAGEPMYCLPILLLPDVPFLVLPLLNRRAVEDVATVSAKLGKMCWPIAILGSLLLVR